MKNIFRFNTNIFVALLLCFFSFTEEIAAQSVPQGFNYQAVARDSEGFPLANKEVAVEISVLEGTPTGTLVYQETHLPVTNTFGLFNLVIGEGMPTFAGSTFSNFSEIDWIANSFFIKVRVDFGSSELLNEMVDMGTMQLLSVPYALVADTALNAPAPEFIDLIAGQNVGDIIIWNGTAWQIDQPFLKKDGSTDLTGHWTIANKNITLVEGTLSAKHLIADDITLFLGQAQVNEFSTDYWLGGIDPHHTSIPTEVAVKWYIDHKDDSIANQGPWTYDDGLNLLYNQTAYIGIGAVPSEKLHIATSTGSFLCTGAFDGVTPVQTSGSGTRMYFSGSKAAFRAGHLDASAADFWNNSNMGNYSAAFGQNTKASGARSFAIGYQNTASGASAFAAGENNIVSGNSAMSFGSSNTIAAINAGSIGYSNILNNFAEGSFAIGNSNNIISKYSLAVGLENTIQSDRSIAIGRNNLVTGLSCISVGNDNQVQGAYSAAFGINNQILAGVGYGLNSLVSGELSKTQGTSAVALGFQNFAKESFSVAMGNNCTAFRASSVAIGNNNFAEGGSSVALGRGTYAYSFNETTVGSYNTSYLPINQTDWSVADRLFVVGNGTSTSARSDAFIIWKDGKTGIGTNNRNDFSGTVRLVVAGDIKANGTVYPSDERLKTNILPLENTLEKVMKLRSVNYYWRTTEFPERNFSNNIQFGLIAQEVEQIFPEMVQTDSEGFKSVNYTSLIPVLIETIQTQQQQIEELKNANSSEQATIENLTEDYEELKTRLDAIEALIKASASAE